MAPTSFRMMVLGVALLAAVLACPLRAEEAPLLSYRKPPTENTLRPVEIHADPAVQQAAHTTPPRDPRRLAPKRPSPASANDSPSSTSDRVAKSMSFPQIQSFTTAGAGLGIVVGLFLLCMWLVRRSGPKPNSALPQEAVAVLGRVPLAARHFAQLIQVGRKLVLVSVTPDGVTPITEVSDPMEVDRLLGLCMRSGQHSSTAQFQQVLQQLSKEPAQGFLGSEAERPSAVAGKS